MMNRIEPQLSAAATVLSKNQSSSSLIYYVFCIKVEDQLATKQFFIGFDKYMHSSKYIYWVHKT